MGQDNVLSSRTVLLPVDVQEGFFQPDAPRLGAWDFEPKGLALLSAWRRTGWPIIHIRHDSVEPESRLRPDRAGNPLRPGFAPHAGEPLIAKSVNSAFLGTDLDLRLKRLGPTGLLSLAYRRISAYRPRCAPATIWAGGCWWPPMPPAPSNRTTWTAQHWPRHRSTAITLPHCATNSPPSRQWPNCCRASDRPEIPLARPGFPAWLYWGFGPRAWAKAQIVQRPAPGPGPAGSPTGLCRVKAPSAIRARNRAAPRIPGGT